MVGDAIEVNGNRDRDQELDPVSVKIRAELEALLESSKTFCKGVSTGARMS